MESENKSRKDIIKNIAIIFLVIMLILTFFSNTIMNYSLPEVSAQYATSGNVSETIRGSGVVEAEKSYDVTVEETRVIKSVNVKTGDTVKKGDIIYTLEDKESTELEEARKTLSTMETDYRKALITADGNTGYAKELLDIENAKDDLEKTEKEYRELSEDPYDYPDVRSAQRSIDNSEEIYRKYDDKDFLKEKYPAEHQNLDTLNSEMTYLRSQAEKTEFFGMNSSELQSLSAETDLALSCIDTDDLSPLPAEWYNKIHTASQNVKSIEQEISDKKSGSEKSKQEQDSQRTAITDKKTRIEGYIAALDTDDMLGLPADDYDSIKDLLQAKNDAQSKYDTAKANYEKVSSEVGTLTDYDSEISAKQREIRAKNAEIEQVNEDIVSATMSTAEDKYDTLNDLYKKSRSLHIDLTNLNEELEALLRKKTAGSSLASKLNRASTAMNNAQTALTNALKNLNAAKKVLRDKYITELNDVKRELEEFDRTHENTSAYTYDDREDNSRLDAAKETLNSVKNEARAAMRKKKSDIEICIKYLEKKSESDKAASDFRIKVASDKAALKDDIDKARTSLETLVDDKKNQISEKKKSLESSISEKKHSLRTLEEALSSKRKADGVEERQENLELETKQKQISDQKALIEKLEKKAVGASITAPVGGIIQSLAYSAGESTTAGNSSAVIEMVDNGFKLTFSVKTEQAKKLKTGTNADVASNYFGGDITAELTSIKPDKTNPQTNKSLEFRITGSDVKAGDNITLTIGARGEEYQSVIPNSALREDKNGKHVLVVESKSSPLGSRYYAVRYPVQVLAQNDTLAAVSGLSGSEFIVTTSSVPIEAGKQVKLSETQS